MAIWAEYRCRCGKEGCPSTHNSGPQGLYANWALAQRDLDRQARVGGWWQVTGGWLCPLNRED